VKLFVEKLKKLLKTVDPISKYCKMGLLYQVLRRTIMSKKEIAVALYQTMLLTNPNPSRKDVITAFMTHPELMMSEGGASTYNNIVRQAVSGGATSTPKVKSEKSKPTKNKVDKTVDVHEVGKSDTRQLYSKCFYREDEIVFIMANYDRDDTLKSQPQTPQAKKYTENTQTICIVGVPTDSETLSQVKERYTQINL
jgi:hypothetical protein